ncbi:MAG: helix-turn-helix domain-containing protein [Tepidisphaeraceae bacterium]
MTLTDTIRKAIETSGMTRYGISKLSGVGQDTLSKFVRGGGLKLESADRLCKVLKLKLTKDR